jgi:lysophospholipase L1-like esterase
MRSLALLALMTLIFVGCQAPEPEKVWDTSSCPSEEHVYPEDLGLWKRMHETQVAASAGQSPDLVFIGDSITAGWKNAPAWSQFSASALNFGIGGDNSAHVLWRLRHGMLDGLASAPRVIVLLIGFNDYATQGPPAYVSHRINCVVQELRERAPNSKILHLAVLPSGPHRDSSSRLFFEQVNPELRAQSDGRNVVFLDSWDSLVNADGSLSTAIFSDYVHPTSAGYAIMEPKISTALSTL